MTIEIFGVVSIVLAIVMPFMKLKYNYILMVFFSIFTATSAFNISISTLSLSIIPVHIISLIFMTRMIPQIFKNGFIQKKSLFLALFVIWCIISVLLLPIIDDYVPDHVTVRHYFSGEGFDPIFFSIGNVTQLMYLLYGYLVYFITCEYLLAVKNPLRIIQITISTIIWGALAICIIGIYELVAKYFGWPFMSIFRNFFGVVEYTNYRISSVANEPSMFAYFIVISLSLYYFHIEKGNQFLMNNKKIIFLFIMIIGLLSTSTTFLLGFLVLSIIIIFDTVKKHKLKLVTNPARYFSIFVIIGLGTFILNIPFIKEKTVNRALETLTFSNFSGADRIQKVMHHVDAFQYSPILGMGFGTTRSYDGFTTILTNLGIIGFVLFVSYIFVSVKRLKKAQDSIDLEWAYVFKSINAALICWFIMFMIAVPEIYYIYIWILFAINEVVWKVYSKEKLKTRLLST